VDWTGGLTQTAVKMPFSVSHVLIYTMPANTLQLFNPGLIPGLNEVW